MIRENIYQVSDDKEDRSAYRRVWGLCMMPADVEAFSDALKAAIPGIRFVSRDYWEQFVDQERWKSDCLEHNRRQKLGLPKFELRRYMRDPTGAPLRYRESLADPAERRFLAWVEPPGWRPIWGPEETSRDPGVRYIENAPRHWFYFQRSQFIPGWPKRFFRENAEQQPANARETVVLEGQYFEVRWNPAEPEAEAFGKKVYNVLRKLTVSRFVRVDRDSRRAYTGATEGMLRTCLAGHRAVAWAMKRRHNYLKIDSWGVLLKPTGYPFKKRDVFTPREYKQLIDDEEAELQARIEQKMEELRQEARDRRKSGQPPELELLVDGFGIFSGLKMKIPIGKPASRKSN